MSRDKQGIGGGDEEGGMVRMTRNRKADQGAGEEKTRLMGKTHSGGKREVAIRK